MADNVVITPGTGNTVAADEVTDATLGTVKVQFMKIMDGTLDSTNKAVIDAAGDIQVDVNNFPATQPISVSSLPLPTGAATETTLSTLNVKVTTVDTAHTTISNPLPAGTNVIGHVIVDTAPTTPVTGTFFQATQPVSIASMPSTPVTGTFFQATQPVSLASTTITGTSVVQQIASTLLVTGTAATGTGVTVTLPAVAGQFHYISFIEITKYFTVANAASATPLVITTTNLPGSYAITFGQPLGTVGTTDERIYMPAAPLKSSVVNTATTIVCPATTGIIWRVNIQYYTAP